MTHFFSVIARFVDMIHSVFIFNVERLLCRQIIKVAFRSRGLFKMLRGTSHCHVKKNYVSCFVIVPRDPRVLSTVNTHFDFHLCLIHNYVF
jgi:hypothetical protein